MLLELRHVRAMSQGYGQVQQAQCVQKGNGSHQTVPGTHIILFVLFHLVKNRQNDAGTFHLSRFPLPSALYNFGFNKYINKKFQAGYKWTMMQISAFKAQLWLRGFRTYLHLH